MSDYEDDAIPFPAEVELCKDIQFTSASQRDSSQNFTNLPIDRTAPTLPGEPTLQFHSPNTKEFLCSDLLTPRLNDLSPYLWLVATQRSNHISPLHHQLVKGRHITVAETSELHCTWIYDRIFLKPIPLYLLSWAFWRYFLTSPASPLGDDRERTRNAAIGFLRSYSHLIKYPSDFRVALENHLIPQEVTYDGCRKFLSYFAGISDAEVSRRYHFGELRLARINFWGKIFLRQFLFQKVFIHYSYSTYFSRFYGPLLFLFAFLSTTLSAMQVELALNSVDLSLSPGWKTFSAFCRWFSIVAMGTAFLLLILLLLLLVSMFLREFIFALGMLLKKRGQQWKTNMSRVEETARAKGYP